MYNIKLQTFNHFQNVITLIVAQIIIDFVLVF